MNDLISIVVPVYNTKPYLQRCLDSILDQHYKNIEIVLVDDGSTDGSEAICDEYRLRDRRIVVIHKLNGGLGSARVTGIKEASGAYIGFVDSDDWIEPTQYEELYRAFQEHDEVDIIIGTHVMNYPEKERFPFPKGKERMLTGIEALDLMFAHTLFGWSLWDKLYRRDLFEKTDLLKTWKPSFGEDSYANFKLFQQAENVLYVPIDGYHYVIHPESMMHRKFQKEKLTYFEIWNEILIWANRNGRKNLEKNVANVMLNDGLSILYAAEKAYEQYHREISVCIHVLETWISDEAFLLADVKDEKRLRYRYEFIDRSLPDYKRFQEMRDAAIREFCKNANIYIYGAGFIGNETAELLGKLEIPYRGFIVSVEQSDTMMLRDKPIFAFQSMRQREIENAHFLLAMNKKNVQTVSGSLQIQGIPIFDAGKYSFFYMD